MPVNYNDQLRLAYLRAATAAMEYSESKIQSYRDFFEGEQGVTLTDRQELYLTQSPESFANICARTIAIPHPPAVA